MKLQTIVNVLSQRKEETKPLIIKVGDSIKTFKRKIELIPSFKELNDIYEVYIKEEQSVIKVFIENYCEEENKRKKPNEPKLESKDVLGVPPSKMPAYIKKINEILNTEVDLKKPIKFSEKEIEDSGIVLSEIIRLEEFIK